MNNPIRIITFFLIIANLTGCQWLHQNLTFECPHAAETHAQVEEDPNWQPNEGMLVRAGDLLMQQQRELGHIPSNAIKSQYLIQYLNISQQRANIILDELGIY